MSDPTAGSLVTTSPGRAARPGRRGGARRPATPAPQQRTSRAACSATPGTTCAASRCSGSPPRFIMLFLLMAAVPAAVHARSTRTDGEPDAAAWQGPVVGKAGSATTCRATTSTPGRSTAPARRSWSAVSAALGTVLIGGLVGILAGYLRRLARRAAVPARATSSSACPFVLGAIVILSTFNAPGTSPQRGADHQPGDHRARRAGLAGRRMRIMRSAVLSAKQQDYVQAARALGAEPRPDHLPAHAAQLPRARAGRTPRSRSARSSAPRRRCPSSASACSRRSSPGA